ncbi:hypothetical protein J3F83DRAFT_760076 [Trichoderma novae-zelandiae]
MGCLSHRRKETRQYTDQKWDYINLSDFKAKGCGAVFAYITLWMGLIISLAVYGVDTFTAVQLLVFNRWSSEIEPAIPLSVSRWIFSSCIILSFINLGFEWVRAARKIKRGNVAEVYLDSLAVRWESIRLGSGQGFKRFLVFGELTKSKKGVEYIALFTYFSFQSWIRVLFCTSPRQVVNALTLRSVYMAQLAVSSDSVEGSISAFFDKIKTLAQQDFRQAAILGGMCFTIVVWVFSALYLISAALFYVFFLFHWIPRTDGGLTGYCERKVNGALLKIVTKTVNQALAKGQADRMKRAMTEKGDAHPDTSLPTLPNVNRLFTSQQVGVTPPLPAYTSNPGTPAGDFKRQMPPRSMTGASTMSYSSRAPLVNSAADMGYTHTRTASPENMAPTVPYLQRTGTGNSMRSNASPPDMSHTRNGSNSSPASMGPVTASSMYTPAARPIPPRAEYNSFNQHMQDDGQSWRGPPPRSYTFNNEGRSSPAPSAAGSSYSRAPPQPVRSATNQVPLRGLRFAPQRQMTEPMSGQAPTDSYYNGNGSRMPPKRPLRQDSQNFYDPQAQGQPGANYGYDVEAQNNVMLLGQISYNLSHLFTLQNAPLSLFTTNASIAVDATMPSLVSTWHPGEIAMHRELRTPRLENPTSSGCPTPYAIRVMHSQLVALGTLDDEGRPWTTVWGGERGFARPVAEGVLGVRSAVDKAYDPVYKAFWASSTDKGVGADEEGIVRPEGGKMMSALSIDLETRDRVKLAGRLIAGADIRGPESEVQLAFHVEESLGNCPKYINKKALETVVPQPELVPGGPGGMLPPEAVALIEDADMLFLSSTNGVSMDTNHRGGPRGFIRVLKNDEDGVELVYPEYSGNRLYQSLGNLKVNPLIGIVIPDYTTSDALYLTGYSTILLGKQASDILPRSNIAVKITLSAFHLVKASLPFRGTPNEPSPYNPPVRYLLSEKAPTLAPTDHPDINATLVARDILTPTISVFTFKLETPNPRTVLPQWQAGHHVTLNFETEVSGGYEHMNDQDPQSLNDDYVRTFTVSSPPGSLPAKDTFQITARLHGPVTRFLWRHNTRVPLDVQVMGFGGKDAFALPVTMSTGEGKEPVYVAGGVGITPLLAQGKGVIDAGVPLKLLWTLRGEDLALAIHAFDQIPGLAERTTLFATGLLSGEDTQLLLEKIRERGVEVVERRITGDDLGEMKGKGKKFYLCTGSALLKTLRGWLEGEDVVWEDFGY